MNIIKIIAENWDAIITIAVIVTGIIIGIRNGETAKIKALLFNIITEAEKLFGASTGILKASYVAEQLYSIMPNFTHCLFTQKQIEKLIEDVLVQAKAEWDKNKALGAYATTAYGVDTYGMDIEVSLDTSGYEQVTPLSTIGYIDRVTTVAHTEE